ncbi:MAG: hypothetical protein ACXVAX_00285 [Pseudobdellovibrio sp.]
MHNSSLFQRVRIPILLTLFSILSLGSPKLHAQSSSAKNKSPYPVKYTSLADQNILLRTITLAPVYDNLNGIYAQPIQKLLTELLQNDKAWGYAEIVGHDQNKFIENYDLNPNDVLEVLSKTGAQGLLTAFITKGPRGLNAKLKLFTHDQGLILAEESVEDFNEFEISKLRIQFAQMYQNLKNKLPYRGYVLSRRGSDVTISLGTVNGVKEGQELTLAQIIKLNRHPKLKTLVGVEKEIIAKVIVKKADPYLSFAQITFEKETGVVDVGAKVLPTESINYPTPVLNPDGTVAGDATPAQSKAGTVNSSGAQTVTNKPASEDSSDAETDSHREELLDRHNKIGSVTVQGTITQYTASNSLAGGQDSTSTQSFAPGFLIGGRYNFYKEFFVEGSYQTSSFSVSNGLNGSSPFSLSVNYNQTAAFLGYDYTSAAEDENEDSIRFTGLIGFASFNSSIDNSSPIALTSTKVSALALELRAAMPVTPNLPLIIGGKFDVYLAPNLSESPVSSGSSSTSITSFGFFGVYKYNENYNLRGDLVLTDVNNHFSGSTTRSPAAGSGKTETTAEQFGIEYLF